MKNLLAARLRELRGVESQADFAAKIGVKQTSYSSWERGIKDPLAQTIVLIANTLGVSADWLLGLSDEREPVSDAAPKSRPGLIGANHSVSEAGLLAEIRALKSRVSALESQSSFACG